MNNLITNTNSKIKHTNQINDSNIYETLTGVSSTNTGTDSDFTLPKKWFAAWGDMIEDQGDLDKSAFFKNKYEGGVMKAPTRKSGVRVLLVPEL